jgi:hypothetical protein
MFGSYVGWRLISINAKLVVLPEGLLKFMVKIALKHYAIVLISSCCCRGYRVPLVYIKIAFTDQPAPEAGLCAEVYM